MSLTKFTGATNNIQGLADKPTETAEELKELFDKTGDDLKTYINETLTEEIDTELSSKANSNNVYTKNDVYTKNEVDEEVTNCKTKGDFVAVRAEFSYGGGDDSVTVDLPTGFTAENCVIISVCGMTSYGLTNGTDAEHPTIPTAYVRIANDIYIRRNDVFIEEVIVTLMKIS